MNQVSTCWNWQFTNSLLTLLAKILSKQKGGLGLGSNESHLLGSGSILSGPAIRVFLFSTDSQLNVR